MCFIKQVFMFFFFHYKCSADFSMFKNLHFSCLAFKIKRFTFIQIVFYNKISQINTLNSIKKIKFSL